MATTGHGTRAGARRTALVGAPAIEAERSDPEVPGCEAEIVSPSMPTSCIRRPRRRWPPNHGRPPQRLRRSRGQRVRHAISRVNHIPRALPSRSQFWSHSSLSGPVRTGPPRTFRRRSGRPRPPPDPHTNRWKACWGQPLTSSNLVSSAIALTGQYVEGPRSSLRGPSTLVVTRRWPQRAGQDPGSRCRRTPSLPRGNHASRIPSVTHPVNPIHTDRFATRSVHSRPGITALGSTI